MTASERTQEARSARKTALRRKVGEMDRREILTSPVYSGNEFSVSRVGDTWAIWRFYGDDGETEILRLAQSGMDELAAYFTKCYAEDREDVA